jgi:CRISPR-associated endonuclease Cas3-HD
VSELSGRFSNKLGLKNCGALIGLVHDLGKAIEEFQNYIRSAERLTDPDEDEWVDAHSKKDKVDHSTAGVQIVHRNLSTKGTRGSNCRSSLTVVYRFTPFWNDRLSFPRRERYFHAKDEQNGGGGSYQRGVVET